MSDKNSGLSSLMIIAAGVLWGGIGLFVAILSSVGFSRIQIVALRLVTAAVLFAAVTLVRSPQLFKFRWKDAWCFAGSGLISLAFSNLCYFTAIERLSLSAAVILLYTSPVFVMFFSVLLFGEKLTGRKCGALFLTMAGCAMVTGIFDSGAGTVSLVGVLCGLAAGLTYALYTVFTRFALMRGYDPAAITLHSFLWAAAGVLPLSGLWKNPQMLLGRTTILGSLGLGVACCIAPYWLYNQGLQKTEPSRAAIFATVEPAVAMMVGVFALNETMTVLKFAGMILVFTSLFILNSDKRPQAEGEAEQVSAAVPAEAAGERPAEI